MASSSTAPSTAAPAALTHCPTCGAKRTRPDSTLCAYCATPFDLVAPSSSEDGENPNLARLARMKEHKNFESAMAWKPLESFEYQDADDRKARARKLIGFGAVLLGASVPLGQIAWMGTLGVVLAVLGVVWIVRARSQQAEIMKLPLLRRPAIVLDRRSDTAMGFWSGATVYFFELEFDDGSSGEFRWPGRGVDHQPLVTGATGLAFTRGGTLLGFQSIRV
ncbi:MAG: hypothetical protein AAF682_04935 [Planctomycetota bacterium]